MDVKKPQRGRPTFQMRPVGDRTVTQATVNWLKQSGASTELLEIAQNAVAKDQRLAS